MALSPNDTEFDTLVAQLAVHNRDDSQWREGWSRYGADFIALWRGTPTDMRYGLMAGVAMIHAGQAADGTALLSYLCDRNPIIRVAQYDKALPVPVRQASSEADIAIRRSYTQAQDAAIDALGRARAGRIASALWRQTHYGDAPRTTPTLGPRPHMFFAPDLPDTPVFTDVPWAEALNRRADAIRAEFLSLMTDTPEAGAPYVRAGANLGDEWSALKGQKNWTAVHLFKMGVRQPAADLCPATLAALADVPTVQKGGGPMEVFFSVLAPGMTIPAHYGLANVRTTVHLPLIVPSEPPQSCAIRVADVTHHWVEGETFVFDDSFDHSAWNKSDAMRVVLIFEAWRPDMSAGEIEAVEASYSARECYLKDRDARVRAIWPR